MEMTRRQLLRYSTVAIWPLTTVSTPANSAAILKSVPSSGEQIPPIGMGTWGTFNVGANQVLRDDRCEVLGRFFALGGRMVDSSPMYGSSEEVLGYCEAKRPAPEDYMRTTKVWTPSDDEGRSQIDDSFHLWKADQFGLYQVHNLVNWQNHLAYLRELKAAKKIRYIGITTSHGRRHRDLGLIMENEDIDFVQLTYNLQDREAEKRLLPLAIDRGIGIVVNRPFRRAGLFAHLKGVPLPDWADEIGCTNMAQVLLKFIISHPAVTCAIPATSLISHLEENMQAQFGPMPDQSMRKRMVEWFDGI